MSNVQPFTLARLLPIHTPKSFHTNKTLDSTFYSSNVHIHGLQVLFFFFCSDKSHQAAQQDLSPRLNSLEVVLDLTQVLKQAVYLPRASEGETGEIWHSRTLSLPVPLCILLQKSLWCPTPMALVTSLHWAHFPAHRHWRLTQSNTTRETKFATRPLARVGETYLLPEPGQGKPTAQFNH